ncbi:hypothetical protein HPB50_001256 [Hyalomma asiaticum]|uniref:Uncharacterized protein n=1 Tax=Hyalomma asiaticum TaxID=266040 RepID=A0ACB7RJB8_HYAAI|nr:hypothetical protein HPB50_001256 [Hyalomma asiaticum]
MVSNLAARVDALEKVAQTSEPVSDSNTGSTITKLASEVRKLAAKCDDSENRQRRNNLISLEYQMRKRIGIGRSRRLSQQWNFWKYRVLRFADHLPNLLANHVATTATLVNRSQIDGRGPFF